MRLITRDQWGARASKRQPVVMPIPTSRLYVHHSGSWTFGASAVRAIQNYHMDTRNWNDIAYNFLIDYTGDIYVGRGVGVKGGHVKGTENGLSHGICVLGNFQSNIPTTNAQSALVTLMRHGLLNGWWQISQGAVRGHREFMNTACPGKFLFDLLPELTASAMRMTPSPVDDNDKEYPEMIIVRNQGPEGAVGACLHICGNVAILIDNTEDLKDFTEQGVPVINVTSGQFKRYETIRVA